MHKSYLFETDHIAILNLKVDVVFVVRSGITILAVPWIG